MTQRPAAASSRSGGGPVAAPALFAGEPVRIGFFMSMTGRDASFGEASLRGARLAVDGLNAAGGVLGRPVELVVEDDRSLAGESATAAKKLISRDRVVALVGECSSARTLEAASVAQASGVPMVTPAATSPRVTRVGDEIFRVCFVDDFQGRVIATFARRRLGLRRAALLVDSTCALFGRACGRVLEDVHGARRRDRREPEVPRERHGLQGAADGDPRRAARRAVPAGLLCRGGPRGAAGQGARAGRDAARGRRLRGAAAARDRRRRPRGHLLLDALCRRERGRRPRADSWRRSARGSAPPRTAWRRSRTTRCGSWPTRSGGRARPTMRPSGGRWPRRGASLACHRDDDHQRPARRRQGRRHHHDQEREARPSSRRSGPNPRGLTSPWPRSPSGTSTPRRSSRPSRRCSGRS
jgi:hypothetical protein